MMKTFPRKRNLPSGLARYFVLSITNEYGEYVRLYDHTSAAEIVRYADLHPQRWRIDVQTLVQTADSFRYEWAPISAPGRPGPVTLARFKELIA